MKLPEPLEKLSQMKHAKPIGLIAVFLIDVLMLVMATMLDAYTGYYLLLIGLVAVSFIVLYLFGWRDGKNLAIIGIALFLLLGAVNGPLVVHNAYSAEPDAPVTSTLHIDWVTKDYIDLDDGTWVDNGIWYNMTGGTVDTYIGNPGLEYRFHVTVYSNRSSAVPLDIRLGYARGVWGVIGTPTMNETDPLDTNYQDGKEFYSVQNIPDAGIYSYWFAIVFNNPLGTSSLNSTMAIGPLVGTEIDNWGSYIPLGAVSMFCNIGLLFLIIIILYWWLNVAKEKRKTWDVALRMKEEEDEEEDKPKKGDSKVLPDALDSKPFTCDQCGAGVGEDDNFCPKCGERFDGEEEAENSDEPPKTEKEGPE
ncbi:MAG: zinc ribbon domain-containing protein [Thermoplasmata archaeon]|nr:zinc ribbon domain-containing protein [Thermoplasmata archaeon]